MFKKWKVWAVLIVLLTATTAWAVTTGDKMTFEGPVTISGTLTTTNSTVVQEVNYGAAEATTDAYTATLTPAPLEYTTGMFVAFSVYTANTGASTLNVISLGAKPIVMLNDQVLSNRCLEADQIALSFYDGTSFQLINVCSN